MTDSSILTRKTFGSLSTDEQDALRRSFDFHYAPDEAFALPITDVFQNRQALSETVEYYGERINEINPAIFPYLDPSKREALQQELLFAFYVFSAQYQLDEAEHHRVQFAHRIAQIKKSAQLIYRLNLSKEDPSVELMLEEAVSDSEKHLKYLGLTIIAPFVAERIEELTSAKTQVTKSWMGAFNERRMYWVWGEGFLSSILALLPDQFANKQQTIDVISKPAPALGYVSWILYYSRFGIELSLLLKHTIQGPWMSEEERKIPAWERFKTQWNHRKFAMLNDSVWATVNLITFFWLTGRGMKGYYGDVLTVALLVVDLSLNIWRVCEETTRHNQEMARFAHDETTLRNKLKEAKDDHETEKTLQHELAQLLKAKERCEFDWHYKKHQMSADLVYAAGLIIGFAVMCNALFPPTVLAPATSMMLAAAGGAACFALTVAYAAVSGALEIDKAQKTGLAARKECQKRLEQFKSSYDPNIKKQLYLDMKHLMAKSDYHEQMVQYQKMALIRTILIDALFPSLVFVSLMFLPLGVGIGALAVGVALAALSQRLLVSYKPKDVELPELDEKAYHAFEKDPELAALLDNPASSQATKCHRLFSSNDKDITDIEEEKDLKLDDLDLSPYR